jgi:hypothetical protein
LGKKFCSTHGIEIEWVPNSFHIFGEETYSFHVPVIKTGFLGIKLILNNCLQELGELK